MCDWEKSFSEVSRISREFEDVMRAAGRAALTLAQVTDIMDRFGLTVEQMRHVLDVIEGASKAAPIDPSEMNA